MLWDHLRVVRFERQVRLWERVRHFLAGRGMDAPTRTIALNIALPLLQNATLEEDDDLQDVWARLLVNGGDAHSGIELHPAFGAVLAQMTAFDVRNLAQIDSACRLAEPTEEGVWTIYLPETAMPYGYPEPDAHSNELWSEVEISLSNLERLGCITQKAAFYPNQLASLTPFGRALIQACTK